MIIIMMLNVTEKLHGGDNEEIGRQLSPRTGNLAGDARDAVKVVN